MKPSLKEQEKEKTEKIKALRRELEEKIAEQLPASDLLRGKGEPLVS